jgi:hypothetical protein
MNRILSALVLVPSACFAQTISYTWPGPLGQVEVYPKWTDGQFMGTRTEWHGVTSVSGEGPGVQDLRMTGWPCEPGKAYLMMNVLAFEALMLDSITIIHRHGAQGPKRLLVAMSTTGDVNEHVIGDPLIADEYTATRISLQGLVRPPAGAEYGYVQVKLIPYGGADGTWDVASVVIHASRPKPKAIDRSATIAEVLQSRTAPDPRVARTAPAGQ